MSEENFVTFSADLTEQDYFNFSVSGTNILCLWLKISLTTYSNWCTVRGRCGRCTVKQWWIQTAITGFSVTKSVKMVVWHHCLPLRNHHWWPEAITVLQCMTVYGWCWVRLLCKVMYKNLCLAIVFPPLYMSSFCLISASVPTCTLTIRTCIQ